ncbi:ubiquitin carboxyl-terminal hydrolase 35 [Prorops nasuta]|uniref:ubiquitin carboxyl-terminal hydrolase 35 n=1 Tax=Prorops nasuta TaxID=863751 RepID=UPI0034CFEABB
MDTYQDHKYSFEHCLCLIISGTAEEVKEGWTLLMKIEDQGMCNYESGLRDILNESVLNVQEIPRLMDRFSKHLNEKALELNPISNDVATFLRNTNIRNISYLTMILQVLLKHKIYLPQCANHSKLCEAVVLSLGSFSMPQDSKEISSFREHVFKVQTFLETVCAIGASSEKENLIICLQTLYKIILDSKLKQQPGPGLNVVLQMVEPSLIPQAVNLILSKQHSDDQLVQALKLLCMWLPIWPADQLRILIMEFIYGLEKERKYSVLLDVTEAAIDKMFLALILPMSRSSAAEIVYYILKRQSSLTVTRKVLNSVQIYIGSLKKENSESSKECIQNLVDIVKAISLRFPQCQVNQNLKNNFPTPPRMDKVNSILSEPIWSKNRKIIEPIVEYARSNTGKVGLSNLGNTCYMNSVLQALLMTRQFCHEVLFYKLSNEHNSQIVLKKLQNLFALLLYSKRISLAPNEILLASRPAYFLPGQQQDSSEFLCHLLDVLHEQEKSSNISCSNNEVMSSPKSKTDDDSSDNVHGGDSGGNIKRWTTEEDLTEGMALKRKTQSLADFTQGVDLAQTQQLSDSHSDSTDSGIQSVGGEETNMQVSLVHRVLGGESKITYQCAQCDNSSDNTDRFRDLQLCFPEEISENHEVSVQDLINCYLAPEKLTGENKYRCDKCTKLCDAQRIIKILQAPAHLILTLKHFRYDFESRLRTKLRHKVMYNETIQLPVSSNTYTALECETYQLYAAVVHSGYSMDYGHYFTYARDSKNNWFKFNDSYISQATIHDFKNLKPPDTPYILFYEKSALLERVYDEEKPPLSSLSKRLQDLVDKDTTIYIEELKRQASNVFKDNSDDDNPPPSSCRGAVDIPSNTFLF